MLSDYMVWEGLPEGLKTIESQKHILSLQYVACSGEKMKPATEHTI